MRCLNCKGLNIIKRGRRKTRFGPRQLYQCKACGARFADSGLCGKSYPAKVIIAAINNYNLGHSQESAAKAVNRRFRVDVSKNTVGNWIKETAAVCTYAKFRRQIEAGTADNLIGGRTFAHGENKYQFKFHRAKLAFLCADGFTSLGQYIERFEREGCPDFFDRIPNRCSQTKVKVRVEGKSCRNNACRLAELALLGCRKNTDRHPLVQEFMLINDSSTVAVEAPVWLYERSLDTRLSGHIDVLQIRQGLVYVLDYKPGAEKENVNKVVSQLYWYATGLAFRTGIRLRAFRCAWFDENGYFEFDPGKVRMTA